MVCRAGSNYSSDDDVNFLGKNWNGDVQFAPSKLARPRDLKSLVELVAKASEDNQPLHVVGSGWSFEDCASSSGIMVSLNWLTRRLSYLVDDNRSLLAPRWSSPQSGPGGRLVHFEAGIRVASLCEELNKSYLALPTLGGSNGQALAGVISTSTHSGDWNQPPFPDIVRAVHLVFASGQEVWIESASDPLTRSDADSELAAILPCADTLIVRNDRIFNAVRVACGRFGVIYSVVLEVRQQFQVAQVVTTPSRAAVMQALRDGQSTPSVFTPLLRLLSADPVPTGMSDAKGVPYFFQILFNALRPSDVWVTRRWETPGDLPDILPASASSMKDIAIGVTIALHTALGTATAVTAPTTATIGEIVGALIGLPGLGAVFSATATSTVVVALTETTARLDSMIAQGNFNAGVVISSAIDSLWKIPGMSALIAEIEYMVLNGRLPRTARGPHYLLTSGSRADSDQTDFVSDSLEVVFGTNTTDYLDFLDEVLAISPLFPQAGYISMRPSLSSSASLSMHNVSSARAVSFELASIKPLSGNVAWLLWCHHAAIRRNGRPHWGQFNKMQALDTAMLYGDALNNWREGLLALERLTQQSNSTIFSNAFTRQRGLEPEGIARDVTSVKKKKGTITHLCNDSASWSPVTVGEAIQQIRARTIHYFARREDSRAAIVVVSDGQAGFHLRTVADKTSRNNLDELPISTV